MTRARSRGDGASTRGDGRLPADLATILLPEPRAFFPTVIWRWRYELVLAAGISAAVFVLVRALGAQWAVITLSAAAGLCSPPWPRTVTARFWCVVTAHRLRSGFVQARLQTRRGRLPAILSISPAPFGESVRLWCPAGITAEAIRSARSTLAAACWASKVRVIRDPWQTHRVTLEIVRHDLE
jgi:hypothetical protein